jgi:large subunit ribosomal protein L21
MYAIAEINGKQYKVEKDATISVDRFTDVEKNDLTLETVLLYADGENVLVGKPYLDNVKIKATLLGEEKGTKVKGVKFKKRKNYTRTLGHRTIFSQLKINEFIIS